MFPKTHVIVGIIASLAIFILWPSISLFNLGIIFLSSVLIDFDHYLYFIWTKSDFSLAHAYRWFVAKNKLMFSLPENERKKYKHVILLFHGIEFWLLIFLLSFLDKIFIWVLAGLAIHMFVDFAGVLYYKEPLYTKFSQIYVYLSNMSKKPLPSHFNKVIL